MEENRKSVSPHGIFCGCKKTDEYSPVLGCPNPTGKLIVNGEVELTSEVNEILDKLK